MIAADVVDVEGEEEEEEGVVVVVVVAVVVDRLNLTGGEDIEVMGEG